MLTVCVKCGRNSPVTALNLIIHDKYVCIDTKICSERIASRERRESIFTGKEYVEKPDRRFTKSTRRADRNQVKIDKEILELEQMYAKSTDTDQALEVVDTLDTVK